MIRQIYTAIRQRILAGLLAPPARLPASRELASQLGISRNVVLEAYDLLYAEGFLKTRRGAGTYVAEGAAYPRDIRVEPPVVEEVTMGYDAAEGVINFRAGTPDLSMFPRKNWLRIFKEIFSNQLEEILAYGHPEGRVELREAICDYIVRQREVICHPDQIVITAGTTQAIGIVCRLLLGNRNTVILEDPITYDIQRIAASNGAFLLHVPVDDEGMKTALLPEGIQPAFVYVTPSHQFPIGGTLPIQRRIELLNFAQRECCYVVEDDYDSEFRFDGPPLSSLHGLSPGRVIYIGTFSKTLCPALRLGYLVLPHELIGLGRSGKWQSDLHNEVSSQLVLAKFMKEGLYLKHVNRMRKRYLQRRGTLIRALNDNFGERVTVLGSATGLHLVARFAGIHFSEKLLDEIEAKGARFYPVGIHSIKPNDHSDKLLIGYGNLSDARIRKGIEILSRHIGDSFENSLPPSISPFSG